MTDIAGNHTAPELQDLVNAKEATVNALTKAYNSLSSDNKGKLDSSWYGDYTVMMTRYNAAHADALTLLQQASGNISPTTVPAETQYQALIHALQQSPPNTSTGDYQDLANRFTSSTGINPLAGVIIPQPTSNDLTQFPQNPIATVNNAATNVAQNSTTIAAAAAAAQQKASDTQSMLMILGSLAVGGYLLHSFMKKS